MSHLLRVAWPVAFALIGCAAPAASEVVAHANGPSAPPTISIPEAPPEPVPAEQPVLARVVPADLPREAPDTRDELYGAGSTMPSDDVEGGVEGGVVGGVLGGVPGGVVGGVAGGVVGGVGAPPPAPSPLARAAEMDRSVAWSCAFPPEAEAEGIDEGTVVLTVTVDTAGKATSVRVLRDPGYGFGRAARVCALKLKFKPGLDDAGNPATTSTKPIRVRFVR